MPAAAPPVRLLTTREVADELRLSIDSVYRLIHTGRLQAFRIGEHGPLRVPQDSLAVLLRPARPEAA